MMLYATLIKFKELPTLDRSKNMVTREEFTMQRIKKLEEQLLKVRKENRVKEMTNEMYEVFVRKTVSVDLNTSYLHDLRFVIKKNLKQVRELMIKEANGEGSKSNAPQPIVEPMVSSWNNSEGPTDPSPTIDSLMPSPMIDSPMPSIMIAPPMYSPVSPTMNQQMELSMDIPSIGISTSMNNNQNSSVDLPDSPTISGFLNWKDDVVMTLLDDPFFKNNNVQDPNHTKKF
ncbi:hypothetical protein KY290_025374 [Solanum tuberosum]|uniref:Mads box protein n=1 Tax=Solanum tuberosum TaxID=4113 RepID=A0ABQ7UTK3_SOLTU|nr:hypothetical protein KY290_025374 [Solanum tuberosum]